MNLVFENSKKNYIQEDLSQNFYLLIWKLYVLEVILIIYSGHIVIEVWYISIMLCCCILGERIVVRQAKSQQKKYRRSFTWALNYWSVSFNLCYKSIQNVLLIFIKIWYILLW